MKQASTETEKEALFKSWVRQYSDILYSHAVFRGFDHDNALDLVQDTYYSAWKNIDGFEHKASAKNWLFIILKNKITDHYRKKLKETKVQLSEFDHAFDFNGHWAKGSYPRQLTVDPASPHDRADFDRILDGCCQKLGWMQKSVFFMKYIDELESDVICSQLSLTSNNYWTILHRAKVQLRSCLEKNWFLLKQV